MTYLGSHEGYSGRGPVIHQAFIYDKNGLNNKDWYKSCEPLEHGYVEVRRRQLN